MLLACVTLACAPASARILVHEASASQGTVIEIFDTIDYPDATALSAALDARASRASGPCSINVWLDSPGGNVDAAMKIGRLLHDTSSCVRVGRFQRPVSSSNLCASACVLVLAAGAVRLADASIGIHRPYSVLGEGTPSGDARCRAAAERIRAYLEEMLMPARLYEEMMRVSATDVHWLTRDEKRQLGLHTQDTVALNAGR